MEEGKYEELKKLVQEKIGKIHLGGLKGEILHPHLRGMATNLHFKWIQKDVQKIERMMEAIKKDIAEHLVIDAQEVEEEIVKKIVEDEAYLYLTLHSLLLYEKHDLEELKDNLKEIEFFIKGKAPSKIVVNNIMKAIEEMIDTWEDEIEAFRKQINSVWAKTKGGTGWALNFFETMHKQGYFLRYQERKHFRDAIKSEKILEKEFDALAKVKSMPELDAHLKNIIEKDKEIVEDFETIEKLLFSTWDAVTKSLHDLVKIVADAANIHELPEDDSNEMKYMEELIHNALADKFLHALRIDDKQLEGVLADVKDKEKELPKAA